MIVIIRRVQHGGYKKPSKTRQKKTKHEFHTNYKSLRFACRESATFYSNNNVSWGNEKIIF